MQTLDVIFRADRSGEFKGQVTAVFPSECPDYVGRSMSCYVHNGQHVSCSFDWYNGTRPAEPHEYADLLAELRGIYGRSSCPDDPPIALRVVQRRTAEHRRAYERDLQRSRQSLRDDPAGGPWLPREALP